MNRVKVTLTLVSYRDSREFGQLQRLQKRDARPLHLGDQGGLLQFLMVDLLGPIESDDLGKLVELVSIYKEALIDRCRIGDDAQAKAGGTAAIGHRLANVHDLHAADRSIAGDVPFDPVPDR